MQAIEIRLCKKYNAAEKGFIVQRFIPTRAKTLEGLERAKAKAKDFAGKMIKESDGKPYTLSLISVKEVI